MTFMMLLKLLVKRMLSSKILLKLMKNTPGLRLFRINVQNLKQSETICAIFNTPKRGIQIKHEVKCNKIKTRTSATKTAKLTPFFYAKREIAIF